MKRNCLFILVDCLRADRCWGKNKTAKTPNIDMLSRRGTSFTQAIATTTTTSPSVASILTGLYPFAHGVRSLYGYKLNSDITTLAEVFAQNGYQTYAEVTGPLMPQIGISKGFEHYYLRDKSENIYSSWYSDLLAKFKKKQLEEPYFMFIHFFELHLPRHLAKEYDNNHFGNNRYERALSSFDVQLGKLLDYIDEDTVIVLHSDHGEKFPEIRTKEMLLKTGSYFLKLVKLGRKLKKPREKLHFSGHGFHVYDYLIRVPLIFAGKGIFPEDTWISDQVRQIDIFPTIVEALGLKHDNIKIHGRSLLPLIKGQKLPQVLAYSEACGSALRDKSNWLAGIRTPKFKYVIAPYTTTIPDALYDLEKDPNEKKNIATKRPDIVQELRQKLQEIKKADEAAKIKRKLKV